MVEISRNNVTNLSRIKQKKNKKSSVYFINELFKYLLHYLSIVNPSFLACKQTSHKIIPKKCHNVCYRRLPLCCFPPKFPYLHIQSATFYSTIDIRVLERICPNSTKLFSQILTSLFLLRIVFFKIFYFQ